MPLIQEEEIDFDSMSDEELTNFLNTLREETSKRRPRLETKAKSASAPRERQTKPKEYIKVEL